MYVDERDAGVIRRDEGWATMSSKAEGKAYDPRLSLGDFIVELESSGVGPVDSELCHLLWTECAGRARFAEAVLRAAATAGVTVDPGSAAFADWVVELCPRLSLELGAGDTAAASVLAQLSAVSETTAVRALTAVADDLLGGIGVNDPEGVLVRLHSSGILTCAEDQVRGSLLQVPSLIAAKLRHELATTAGGGSAVAALLEVLIEHMESAGTVEPSSSATFAWPDTAATGPSWRVTEAVGIPMFLLTPRTACTAFRLLPPKTRANWPGLEFFGTLAEDIDADSAAADPARIRAAAIRHTGPGLLRSRLPGILGASAPGEDESGEIRPDGLPVDVVGTVRQMIGLADSGGHGDAAELASVPRRRCPVCVGVPSSDSSLRSHSTMQPSLAGHCPCSMRSRGQPGPVTSTVISCCRQSSRGRLSSRPSAATVNEPMPISHRRQSRPRPAESVPEPALSQVVQRHRRASSSTNTSLRRCVSQRH